MNTIKEMIDHKSDDKKIKLDFDRLPKNISISTMTITAKLGGNVNLENFSKYIDLDLDTIWSIKYGDKPECNRELVNIKKKKKKSKKKFFNQATLKIKKTNVKLFKNGAVQMTGCKNIVDSYKVLDILVKQLKTEIVTTVLDENKELNIIEKEFVDDIDNIKISDFKIVMINSNFKVNYSINRQNLYNLLIEQKVQCTFEPCIHACVNIKFFHPDDDKKISIFVFQSGSIIITGANNINHILAAYEYINNILKVNHKNIIQKNLDLLLKNNSRLQDYLKLKLN